MLTGIHLVNLIIYLVCFFLVVAAVAAAVFIHPSNFQNRGNFNPLLVKQFIVARLFTLGLVIILSSAVTTVSSGHVGVQIVFGKVNI